MSIIPTPNGTVRMVLNIRKLYANLIQQPYPIPKICTIIQKSEGPRYAAALDLNIGYYTICLDPVSQDMCTIITPWGRYEYLRLPMGIMCVSDIIQENMSNLMEGLEFVRTYLNNFLCLSKSHFDEHIFKSLQNENLHTNAKKSSVGKTKIDYLGYEVTHEGISPNKKGPRLY